MFWVPIKEVEVFQYYGPVYDLTVSPEHHYPCNGFLVHNCHEPFGMVVVEALSCGTPVIAYKRGAMPEIIQHGKTGFLCEGRPSSEPSHPYPFDELEQMCEAVKRVGELSREEIRKDSVERWPYIRSAQEYVGIIT